MDILTRASPELLPGGVELRTPSEPDEFVGSRVYLRTHPRCRRRELDTLHDWWCYVGWAPEEDVTIGVDLNPEDRGRYTTGDPRFPSPHFGNDSLRLVILEGQLELEVQNEGL
jgi:hypothetical protein